MRAVLFGTYNRAHSANRILAQAMTAVGCQVLELHEPLWERTRDKDASYFGPWRLLRLALAWLGAAWRLAGRWRATGGGGLVVCGFNGQLDVFLARLIAGRQARIVFAPLVTITETLVEDRQRYHPRSFAARVFRRLDLWSFALSDLVVIDSEEHRRYLLELGADPSKVLVCHLGVDAQAFPIEAHPVPRLPKSRLQVLYFGQYLPLHGLDVIVDAVARLAHRDDLEFLFIGTGDERTRVEREVRASRAHATFIDWVEYAELGARVREADIVLGIFGASRKARMVIPNKLYEAAALGCAVLTADTPAIREVFEPGRDLLVCEAQGAALAAAIERLAADSSLRASLGKAAQAVMRENFTATALGASWQLALAGPDLDAWRRRSKKPRLGVVVVNFNDSQATLACLASLEVDGYEERDVLVIDNGSSTMDLENLQAGLKPFPDVRLVAFPENTGYAVANNHGLETLFTAGSDYVLVLNNDTEVGPGACDALVACAVAHPQAGPIGPLVARDVLGASLASLGERYWRSLAWFPRSLLRPRRMRGDSYAVGGVQGCAILFSKALFDDCGGFDERYFAYYEEVDYCLKARSLKRRPRIEPRAEIAHRGHRGFASGMTLVAAYLKARNLWLLGMRDLGWRRLLFVPGTLAMIAASSIAYALRGKAVVAGAQLAGLRAGFRGEDGPPPQALASHSSSLRRTPPRYSR